MLLDLPFAFEVGDPCLPVRAADGAVDEVLYSRRLRRIRERFSLLDLAFGAGLQEVLHGEDAVSVFERPRHSGAVFHITPHNFGARIRKPRSRRLRATAPPCLPVAPVTTIKRCAF